MKCFFTIIITIVFYNNALAIEVNLSKLTKSAGTIIDIEKVVDGLGTPWGFVFISPFQLLVTEREGSIRLIDLKSSKNIRLKNVPKVLAQGQGGMLDVALPPNYSITGWIYFTYVKAVNEQGATVLARAKLKDNSLIKWKELLVTDSGTDEGYHFGSRIAFDDKGHVYFGVGDRGERPNAQDLTNHAGTIIRLNLDGSIPKDNPFISNSSVLSEIWSYGHRNPQGLSYDFKHNRLWEIEHGPRGGDEINLIQPRKNYGWPVISYGKEYWSPLAVGEGTHKKGMEQPKKVYTPSIAPGSLMIYNGDTYPNWKGNLFSGSLKLRHLNRLVLSDEGEIVKEERILESLGKRIRAITESPTGVIYFSVDSGSIYRLRSTKLH